MITIPASFARCSVALHGEERGRAWLAGLPALLEDCARRWDLILGEPFSNLTYHYVMTATRADGLPVVLKACSPTGEFVQEAAALRLCAGNGMAQLLASDDAAEVMLLERLLPGTTLLTLEDDEEATRIAAHVMRQIWRPVPAEHPFPTIARWNVGMARLREYSDGNISGGTGLAADPPPFPPDLVALAEHLYAELSATQAPPVLLHGDLHHDNILAATGTGRAPGSGPSAWLAIDPKGLVGEPAYEVGPWLYNPQPRLLQYPDPRRILAHRIAILAEELAVDPERIRGWGIYESVLSAWWSVEDGGAPWQEALACAQIMADIQV